MPINNTHAHVPMILAHVWDEPIDIDAAIHSAIKAWAKAKPWRGDYEDKAVKIRAAHDALNASTGVGTTLELPFDQGCFEESENSAGSTYNTDTNCIRLTGRLSVITYLLLYARALRLNQLSTEKWVWGLFSKHFPLSFSRLTFNDQGLAVKTPRD